MRCLLSISSFFLLLALPEAASAQYQAVLLQSPEGTPLASSASGGGVAGNLRVTYQVFEPRSGTYYTTAETRAGWWPDWSGAPILLDTVTPSYSIATAISGNTVGGVRGSHAVLWPTGTPNSFIDLNPAGAGYSYLYGMDSTSQGGFAHMGRTLGDRPYVWYGTAASGVDLLPPNAISPQDYGVVRGTAPGIQVGSVTFFNIHSIRAYCWLGTAASGVDYTPATAIHAAFLGIDGNEHVGYVVNSPNERERATLWADCGRSSRSLHPTGYFQSVANATHNGKQAGYVRVTDLDQQHAFAWSGTAESGVDLHAFLGPGYHYSEATGIDENGVISGWAQSDTGPVAVVWVPAQTNQTPTANAGSDESVLYAGAATSVALDGSGSDDLDGDTLTYAWTEGATSLGSGETLSADFGVGLHTVTLTVTDPSGASATDTMTVLVLHSWGGAMSPINADGTSVFKLGKTIPFKFELTGASFGAGDVGARLFLAKMSNDVVGTEEEADSTSSADSGNTFRYQDGKFMFNLSTQGLSVGTWRLRVDVGDGGTHTVLISLR